ncbi:hypothetical protein [Vibrio harveyi]|uniref:hypothetical protein n=1 Tax=Vibrio harveyi TaxID=669 RepID=UPI003CECD037
MNAVIIGAFMYIVINKQFALRVNSSVSDFVEDTENNLLRHIKRFEGKNIELFELLNGGPEDLAIGATLLTYNAVKNRKLHWNDDCNQDDQIHLFASMYLNCQIQHAENETVKLIINDLLSINVELGELDRLLQKSYQLRVRNQGDLSDIAGMLHLGITSSLDNLDEDDLERLMKVLGAIISDDENNSHFSDRLPSSVVPIKINLDEFGYAATSIEVAALYARDTFKISQSSAFLH